MNENAVWARLKKAWGLLPGLRLNRVENSACDGMPDVSGCYEGTDFWIELKHMASFPVRQSTPIKAPLRKAQVLWLRSHLQARGAHSWILVGVGADSKQARFYLFKGEEAGALKQGRIGRLGWEKAEILLNEKLLKQIIS